jgi:hypothetical protein
VITITSKLRRVTAKAPCPVCGKPTGCGISANGEVIVCWRVSDGAYKPTNDGSGWVHLRIDPSRPRTPYIAPLRIIAPAARRHAVYSALLERLPLAPHHWGHLEGYRMLSEETITRCQFATVPTRDEGDRIAAELAGEFDLMNVPGFFWKDNAPRLRFAGVYGFFIPLRDHLGQVSALQIRRDCTDARYCVSTSRYLLVSTPDLCGGACSGAPPHFARHWQIRDALLITEGGLKAEVCAEQLRQPVCGLVAVGTFGSRFGWELRDKFPRLRRTAIAYDQENNEATARQKERLINALEEAGLEVEVFEWEGDAKGYDDFLIAQRRRLTITTNTKESL